MVPEHLELLAELTGELSERFERRGRSLYLVGGSVRDAIVRRDKIADCDLDLTTDALPSETQELLAGWADDLWLVGKELGTVSCSHRGRKYEITTHRKEVYHPGSRRPVVAFGSSITEDLARRDFTVNAMALRLPDFELIDPFQGVGDLAAGRLRTPLEPEVAFDEDPLRMMRAARFIADLDLDPDPSVTKAVEQGRDRLTIVSAERIRDELDKLLVVRDPSAGLWYLVRTGLAAKILPELPALALEQDPVHRHKDVLAHTVEVVSKTRPDRLLRLAALLHDIGKPRTRAFDSTGVSFHHHDVVGAKMARDRMKALRYPTSDISIVSRLVELHLRFHTYRMGWSDSAVRRYVRDAGPLLGRLNELTRCDCTTRNPERARALGVRMDELERRVAELEERERLDAIRADLDGDQVMARLGIPPGALVGEALAFLLELRLDEGPLGEAEAYERLDEWWARRSDVPSGAQGAQRRAEGGGRPSPGGI